MKGRLQIVRLEMPKCSTFVSVYRLHKSSFTVIYGRTNPRMDEGDGWTDGRTDAPLEGQTGVAGRTDGLTGGQTDGRTGACPVLVSAGCLEDFVTIVGRSAKYLGLK